MIDDAVVLYPSPGMGHLVSTIELAKRILCHHRHSFSSITVLLTTGLWDTPEITSYIHSISQHHPSLTFRRLPPVSVDTSPTCKPAAVAVEFISLNTPNVRHALKDISERSHVRALIIDFFCSSAFSIAKELGIATYYFCTSGAVALAAFLQLPKLFNETEENFKELHDVVYNLHGMPPLKATHIPEPMVDRRDPMSQNFVSWCLLLALSDGIIVNTFEELEPIALKAITDGLCVSEKETPSVHCVGPLIASLDPPVDCECLSWLDKQPSQSVVFLCFGSRGCFSVPQILETAQGLERSMTRFLWVVKSPPKDERMKHIIYAEDFELDAVLPEGFRERVKDRGMVVKSWAPQVAVLNHKSVGGFVTHCGWNSVLEAVVAGVPMVAWPLHAEQRLNRNALVEDMELAIWLEQRERDGFVSRTELEKGVRELMQLEKGERMRQRSWSMRGKASAALGESGSSIKAIADLVRTWKGLC